MRSDPEPKESDHYEAGVRGRWPGLHFEVSAYENSSELGTSFNDELRIVRAPEEIRGLEASVDVQPAEDWKTGGTFTWTVGKHDADDDGRPRVGVDQRVEHVTGDALAAVSPLDDAVTDVAHGEHLARFVVPPDVVLQDPGVGTADGDDVGMLGLLYLVEAGRERSGVLGVVREHLGENVAHATDTLAPQQITPGFGSD